MGLPSLHKAVRLHPPSFDIRLEELPIPKIQHEDDAIVKIELSGLCGSDLHAYRGAEPFSEPFIMGHEFVGSVVDLGTSFNADNGAQSSTPLLAALLLGDKVVSPFTTSCGECSFCRMNLSCRCERSLLFGSPSLAGSQAQFVRVPNARGTLVKLDPETFGDIRDESLLLLADILPTGYHAIRTALRHPNLAHLVTPDPTPVQVNLTEEERHLVLGIVGLGPVGLCTLISALDVLAEAATPKKFTILAIDLNPARREKAQAILTQLSSNISLRGAVHVVDVEEAVKAAPGLGMCHAVCEVVGNNSALRLAYDLIRPFGVISSVGVHTSPTFPITGDELYTKNVSLTFGRCPARSFFHEALAILKRRRNVFDSMIVERVIKFGDGDGVKEAYEKFEKGVWGKVVFDPWN